MSESLKPLPNSSVRVGDYALVVDTITKQIFAEYNELENWWAPLGGGRDQGENSMQSLIREISEETENKIVLDPSKVIFIDRFYTIPIGALAQKYDFKEWNIYFYPMAMSSISSYSIANETYRWTDLESFLFEKFLASPNNPVISREAFSRFAQKQNLDLVF